MLQLRNNGFSAHEAPQVTPVNLSRDRIAMFCTLIVTFGLAIDTSSAQSVKTSTDAQAQGALDEIVVTGSLIPQLRAETSTAVTVITSEDIQQKGFATVAEALQRSSFATGNVQGGGETNTFTPGANAVSLFGLSPSYVKYLIDGRPIGDYPALYNGT